VDEHADAGEGESPGETARGGEGEREGEGEDRRLCTGERESGEPESGENRVCAEAAAADGEVNREGSKEGKSWRRVSGSHSGGGTFFTTRS
jgi:hypothetical protein